MARPSNFTPEQILEAAQLLLDEGKKVSGYALIKILGGGNPTSIENKYKELAEAVTHTPKLQALPSVIEESINSAVGHLSKTLVEALTKTYAQLKAEAEITVNQIKELAQTEIQEVRTQLEQAAENEQAETDRAAAVEAQLIAANQTIAALKVDVANRDGQIKTINDAKDTLEKNVQALQGEKQKLEIDNASLTKQIADAKDAVATAKIDAEKAIQTIKAEAKAEVMEAQAEAKKERTEKDAALLKAAGSDAAYQELKLSNNKATSDLAETNKAVGQLEGQIKTLTTQLEEKAKELEAIKALPVPAQEAKPANH